jgi:hypothetical protein
LKINITDITGDVNVVAPGTYEMLMQATSQNYYGEDALSKLLNHL